MPTQWCVVLRKTGEVWRGEKGTWTRDECLAWIAEEPRLEPMFAVARREVTEWVIDSEVEPD